MRLILKSFFFDQTGCQCPANGRMVLCKKSVFIVLILVGGQRPAIFLIFFMHISYNGLYVYIHNNITSSMKDNAVRGCIEV